MRPAEAHGMIHSRYTTLKVCTSSSLAMLEFMGAQASLLPRRCGTAETCSWLCNQQHETRRASKRHPSPLPSSFIALPSLLRLVIGSCTTLTAVGIASRAVEVLPAEHLDDSAASSPPRDWQSHLVA